MTTAPSARFKPYPAYKDSGVEWLGVIPAHWEVGRLKRIVQFRGGGTPIKDNLEYWRGEIPWVSPKDMKVSVVLDTEDKITAEAVRESATKLVPAVENPAPSRYQLAPVTPAKIIDADRPR